MRVLRLPVDGRRIVDLHPSLSVVTDLDAEQAARLRRAVAAVACGSAPPGGGLVEVHGFLLDAEPDDLDLLDLGGDPTDVVLVRGSVLDDPASEALRAVRAAERDVALLATERRWAARARAASTSAAPEAAELVRIEQLQLAIAAHESTDVEPLRRAVDRDRDARRAGRDDGAAVAGVVAALADLGVDLRARAVPADEVRRVADDVLDEHLRHAAWVVGARVELDGLERRLLARLRPGAVVTGGATAALLPESGRRRVERAHEALAQAIARADAHRQELAGATSTPPGRELEWALLRAVTDRRTASPSGPVPLVLDRVFVGCADDDVARILERLEPLARGAQLVVLDDHPAALDWARRAGGARAAVVAPIPAPAVGRSPTMRPTPT